MMYAADQVWKMRNGMTSTIIDDMRGYMCCDKWVLNILTESGQTSWVDENGRNCPYGKDNDFDLIELVA